MISTQADDPGAQPIKVVKALQRLGLVVIGREVAIFVCSQSYPSC